MKLRCRTFLHLAAILVLALLPLAAQAETYPSRPARIIVGFPAGGPQDITARIIAQWLSERLGQQFLVESKAGAGGTIGADYVVNSPPDGYTLLLSGPPNTIAVSLYRDKLKWNFVHDMAPVAAISRVPLVVEIYPGVPAKTLPDLIGYIKANPGKVSVGTSGIGSPSHVFGAFFQNTIQAKFEFIPYRSAGDSQKDLVGGQVDMIVDTAATSGQNVKSGLIKAYVLAGKDRSSVLPDIPTVDEAGLPGMYFYFWHALWVPKGTPKPVIAKLNDALVKAVNDPATHDRLLKAGQEFFPASMMTPDGLAKFQREETEKWWPVIKAQGIKVQ